MTTARPPRLGRRDLMVALVAFWAITSLIFTVGRWFVPNFSVSGVSDRLGPAATDSELRQAWVFDLQTVIMGPPRVSGAMDASGPLTGRLTFEHLDNLEIREIGPNGSPWTCGESANGVPDPECRYEVKVRIRSDDGTVLLVSGNGLLPGVEIDSGFSTTLSAPGLTFNSKAGQCTLGLTAVEPRTVRAAGWVACTALTELRSGATLDLLAAFDVNYRPGF